MERLISIIEYEAGRLQVADVKLSPKAVGTRIGLDKAQLVFIYVTRGHAALDFSNRANWWGITPDFEFRQVELCKTRR